MATVRSSELLAKPRPHFERFRWFGHLERSSGAIRTTRDIRVGGSREAQADTKKLMEKDYRETKLTTLDPQEGAPRDNV